jgi:hypothetical protein
LRRFFRLISGCGGRDGARVERENFADRSFTLLAGRVLFGIALVCLPLVGAAFRLLDGDSPLRALLRAACRVLPCLVVFPPPFGPSIPTRRVINTPRRNEASSSAFPFYVKPIFASAREHGWPISFDVLVEL